MISLLLLMASFVSAMAASLATSVDFQVDHTAPTASIPSGQVIEVSAFYGYEPALPDISVNSSWSYLDCEITDGVARIVFTATRATWPTTWPSSATCSYTSLANSYTVTVNLSDCSGDPACMRSDRDESAGVPNCGTSLTLDGSGIIVDACKLPALTSGVSYAYPKDARFIPGVQVWQEWDAAYKVGGSYAPDTDPRVPGITCSISSYTNGSNMFVRVSDVVRKDATVYCPILLYTTSTGTFAWATTHLPVVIDRP